LALDLPCGREGPGRPGGTALYAAITARRMGRRPAIFTAFGPEFQPPEELRDIPVQTASSDQTTTFEICEERTARNLWLVSRAADLHTNAVPSAWRGAVVVHLAPICGEVDILAFDHLHAQFVGATIQGWLRRFGSDGRVTPSADTVAQLPLARLDAVVLSPTDLDPTGSVGRRAAAALDLLRARVRIVALTRGANGSTIYSAGGSTEVPPWPAEARDTVGAGDVYAAALFIKLAEGADPLQSARFASCVAGLSVEGDGWSRIPNRGPADHILGSSTWAT